MTTFLLHGDAASDPTLQEARTVLRRRGELRTGSAEGTRADILVAALPAGTRTVPGDVAQAATLSGASGLLLLAREALARPLNVLGAGDVVLVSPSSRPHLLSAVDLLATEPGPRAGQQILQRSFWAAWTFAEARAACLSPLYCDTAGATLVWGADEERLAHASLLAHQTITTATSTSRRLESVRDDLGSKAHFAHLSTTGAFWLVYCPDIAAPLWLFSALRMPARWSVSAALANSGSPIVRIPAFPGDLLVAASVSEDRVTDVLDALPLGALDVHRALDRATTQASDWGFIIEAR